MRLATCARCSAQHATGTGLTLVPDGRLVEYGGRSARLPARVFRLLEILLAAYPRRLSRGQIADDLWGLECDMIGNEAANVSMAVSRLRDDLAEAGFPITVPNLPGVGYALAFSDEPQSEAAGVA